jgi:NDP-sugar pyrophosphorylase family protein
LNVIITLAGHSRRFKEDGFTVPKFLIPIDGRPMIEHVISMFDYTDTFHFVLNEEQIDDNPHLPEMLKTLSASTTVTVIEPHDIGPTYSALQVTGISNDEEVIISYCDFFVNWNYQLFKRTIHGYDGAIPSFKGFHPASFGNTYYAYMRLNGNAELLELREKESFTTERYNEHASVGIYYFASWEIFENYSKLVLDTYKSALQEAYTSLHYNHMVGDGLNVKIFQVKNFICWGTPADLKQYYFWSDYFNRAQISVLKIPDINSQVNLIPMAGKGSRFREYGYRLGKPLIPVKNKPMVITACESFPAASKWIFLPRADDCKKYPIVDALDSFYANSSIVPVDHETSGQAATCLLAKNEIFLNNPLFIASCDYETHYSEDAWKEIVKDETIDGAIWTYRMGSFLTKDPKAFAYCELKSDGVTISRIVEKDIISNNPGDDPMALGSFWFRRGKDFTHAAKHAIKNDININGEHYVANSINILLAEGKKFVIFDVNLWVSFGDPFELQVFQYWEEYFIDNS